MAIFKKIKPETHKAMEAKMDKPHFPSFSISLKHLPEAENWKVGDRYKIAFDLEMTGLNISDNFSNVEFDIKGIKVLNKKLFNKRSLI